MSLPFDAKGSKASSIVNGFLAQSMEAAVQNRTSRKCERRHQGRGGMIDLAESAEFSSKTLLDASPGR
jgi:hypothetical protein